MGSRVNRKWVLAKRPRGMVQLTDFERKEELLPPLKDGEYLVKTDYLSYDPAQRGWMNAADTYVPAIPLGGVVRAGGIGTVIESKNERFRPGDKVNGTPGWQEFTIAKGKEFSKIPDEIPATLTLHVCGMVGFTAYFGLLNVGQFKEGDVVVVSGAAGATGSIAGQIARIKGAKRVIGLAGGTDKCKWIKDELGFDEAIDYKTENVAKRLRELAPQGIDLFFDNVGGSILDAALLNLANNGRVVVCGGISAYNSSGGAEGIKNYLNLVVKRGTMKGFIVFDFVKDYPKATKDLYDWFKQGKMKYKEDIQEGFENIPSIFLRLFSGANTGKQLSKL